MHHRCKIGEDMVVPVMCFLQGNLLLRDGRKEDQDPTTVIPVRHQLLMVPGEAAVDSVEVEVEVNGSVPQLHHRPCPTTPEEVPEAEDQDILILPISPVVLAALGNGGLGFGPPCPDSVEPPVI